MGNTQMKVMAICTYLYSCKFDKNGKTMDEISRELGMNGISIDNRTLDKEISQLNRYFYMLNVGEDASFQEDDEDNVILRTIGPRNKYFYHFNDTSPYNPFVDKSTDLTIGELRFLYDAVLSADFMTEEMVNRLCAKIKGMTSVNYDDDTDYFIKHTEFTEWNRYHTNDKVMCFADRICKVIAEDKKMLGRVNINASEKILKTLCFEYGNLNKDCVLEKKFDYSVIPVALVYNAGRYYLVGVRVDDGEGDDNYKEIKAYRLDRIMSLKTSKLPLKNLSQHKKQIIYVYRTRESQLLLTNGSMWFGEDKSVTIKFHNHLLGDIFDRYGKKTQIIAIDDDWSYVKVRETETNAFLAWVFQFGNLMRILEPDTLVKKFKSLLGEVAPYYEGKTDENK